MSRKALYPESEAGQLRKRCLAVLSRYQGSSQPAMLRLCDELLAALTETTKAKPLSGIAAALGQRGGNKGGRSRAQKLTKEERVASARNAANRRWSAVRDARARDAEADTEREAHGLETLS